MDAANPGWTLDSEGHLNARSGRSLYTQGTAISLFDPRGYVPYALGRYTCVKTGSTTQERFVLDCSATVPDRGVVNAFVICPDKDVEGDSSACQGEPTTQFLQFTLTPPLA